MWGNALGGNRWLPKSRCPTPIGPRPAVEARTTRLEGRATREEREYDVCGAEVAELADAPDSKSGGLRAVWVRFPPSAHS